MAEKGTQNPTTGSESDISKAQSQQQPPQRETGEQREQFETGQQNQPELGQERSSDAPDEGLQSETLAEQRTDIEGASRQTPQSDEAESGFVGSEGQRDSSSELVEDEEFDKDGQGATERE